MPRDPSNIDAPLALQRLGFGLFKKVVLAQLLASALVDPVFEAPGEHSSLEVLLGVYGYAAQIFCDFSGYTDMAIGSAALLGYAMPENFDAPYAATSPQDFWRRWHISLSSWLRDYLFIPLGGSRGGPARTAAALGLTMVLGGLWHGAAWTFVAWGAFHGVGLISHRAWAAWPAVKGLRLGRAWRLLAPVLTFHFVCAGWVLFRAPTLGTALEVLTSIVRGAKGPTPFWVAGVVGLALLGLAGVRARGSRRCAPASPGCRWWRRAWASRCWWWPSTRSVRAGSRPSSTSSSERPMSSLPPPPAPDIAAALESYVSTRPSRTFPKTPKPRPDQCIINELRARNRRNQQQCRIRSLGTCTRPDDHRVLLDHILRHDRRKAKTFSPEYMKQFEEEH